MPPNPGSRIEDGIEAQSKGRSEICFHAGIADVRQCTMTFGVLLMNVRDKRTVDRLRAGIALLKREKSQLLQSIAAAPVGLALLDHNQRFVRINAALKVIDGHLANEHIGQTLREVIPEQALHRLVNNLLSMTRLETGVLTVKTEPHDLLDLVSAAFEELGESAGQRRVSFDIPEDLPLVPMDFGLITHVFINLFSNALKYSPPDQPVEVRGRITDDQLEVLVVDRGIGVLREDLGRVFDKFYRVPDVGSSNGLGLGLPICKAFIEAHDGRISLENNPMGGTIVRFVIPLHEAATSWENLKL
jgi:two-component system, OmpR family, sensor histidine kinase KdpD